MRINEERTIDELETRKNPSDVLSRVLTLCSIYIAQRMETSLSLRDLIRGEKSIQAFLYVYLGLSNLYILHSEKELGKGYADIFLEPFIAKYQGIKYSYLIEIKYMKAVKSKEKEKVEKLKAGAERQLNQYGKDEKYKKRMGNTTVIKLALIFSGPRLVDIDEVKVFNVDRMIKIL